MSNKPKHLTNLTLRLVPTLSVVLTTISWGLVFLVLDRALGEVSERFTGHWFIGGIVAVVASTAITVKVLIPALNRLPLRVLLARRSREVELVIRRFVPDAIFIDRIKSVPQRVEEAYAGRLSDVVGMWTAGRRGLVVAVCIHDKPGGVRLEFLEGEGL
jgi:hypothetical protein